MNKSEKIINESGYPLQIFIEDLIEENKKETIWKIQVSEHRWINDQTKDEGFIDLVLRNTDDNFRMIIECKRIIGKWNFLIPKKNFSDTGDLKILSMNYNSKEYKWPIGHFTPNSYESSFCVMENGEKKDSRTLEKISSELLLSLEYFAKSETEFKVSLLNDNPPIFGQEFKAYIPIIITTADLQVYKFDPKDFDVKIGEITEGEFETVPFIRFRKNLSSHIKYTDIKKKYDFSELNKEYDRSVFIVHAEYFIEFLKYFRGGF